MHAVSFVCCARCVLCAVRAVQDILKRSLLRILLAPCDVHACACCGTVQCVLGSGRPTHDLEVRRMLVA